MLKRIITGAGYVVVMVAFFLLRELVDTRIFHALTCFLTVVGVMETAKMLKPFTVKGTTVLSITVSVLFVLTYLVLDYFFNGYGWLYAVDVIAFAVIGLSVYCIIKGVSTKTFLLSCIPLVYPTLLLLFMLLSNDRADYGFIILLLSFVISPLSDTFAYFVGSLIGGKKLCPKISPKKTWSGAIGGTVGGGLGGLIVYLIFKPQINFFSPVLFFIFIGLVASIVNIFGDLTESYLKRKCGVKDSGKILPGHGGILDRIDGTSFVVPFIYLLFLLV